MTIESTATATETTYAVDCSSFEVVEEFVGDDGKPYCEEQAYVSVRFNLRETTGASRTSHTYYVGVVVGCPDWRIGSMHAARSGMRPFAAAWWEDISDYQDLPAEAVEAVLDALYDHAYALYSEAVAARPSPETDEDATDDE